MRLRRNTPDVTKACAPWILVMILFLLLITYVGVLKYMAENPKEHKQEAPTGALLGKAGV